MDDRLQEALSGRYTIERELGAGAMATVWLAHDVKHDRQVAIKVLHPQLAAVVGKDRFLTEIRTTANLQHPNILPLFDSGEAEGRLFYVMPRVTGESLRDRITREHQLPVADAVRITSEVASALDYAHRQGVIHRDIKPENVLLHDGHALVADFGIALAPNTGDTRLTETGVSIGTPAYMSPEQALGDRSLDSRCDVYSLGALLYEMLTGAPPFMGPSVQAIVAKVITGTPAPPSQVRPDVPPHVERAVLKALEKNPGDRFVSAAAMGAALEGSGPVAIPAARGARAVPARWTLFIAAGVTLAAIGLLAVRPWQSRVHTPRRPAPDTMATRLVAEAAEFAKRRDPASCRQSITLYSRATERDTTFAKAWADLAKARALCALFGDGDPSVEFAAARGPAETALRLDNTLSDAYTARGMVHLFHEQDWAGAERDFMTAIRLDSTRYEPWLYRAWYYFAMNRLDSALWTVRRAKQVEPALAPIVRVRLATVLRINGDLAGAEREIDDLLRSDSTNALALGERLESDLSTRACGRAGKVLQLLGGNPQQYSRAIVAYYWAICGNRERAQRYADSVSARTGSGSYVDYYALAIVYAGLADSVRMFSSLNHAIADHNWGHFFFRHHYAFARYRSDPAFVELLARAHLK